MALYDYRWGNNWGTALASLSNVEDYLRPYGRLRILAPKSQPLDLFPVETVLGSGRVRGDGRIDTQWGMVMPIEAYHFILTDKFTNGTVKSVKQTIYTRRHELETYARYNCWLVQPSVRKGTLTYLRQNIVQVTFELTALLAL